MSFPISPVEGLCLSSQNLETWREQVNLQLDLTLQAINEELGTEFELPGIPPIPLPDFPGIEIPGVGERELGLNIRKPVPPAGYIGNRFGIRHGGKPVEGKLRFGALPGFFVGGPGGLVVPGTDPSEFLISWTNQNYEILAQQLEDEGIEWEPILLPKLDMCSPGEGDLDQTGGGVSPGQNLVNELVRLNNENAENAAAAGAACVPILIFDPTDACWSTQDILGTAPENISLAVASTSVTATIAGPYPSFNWSGYRGRRSYTLSGNSYSSTCHVFPCTNGITVSADWAVTNRTNKTQAEAIANNFSLQVGGGPSSNVDSNVTISGHFRKVSDGSLVSGSVKSAHSTGGLDKNALVDQFTDRPVVIDSGSFSLSWTAAEVNTLSNGEDLYFVVALDFKGLVIISAGDGAFAQDATTDSSITNLDLSLT